MFPFFTSNILRTGTPKTNYFLKSYFIKTKLQENLLLHTYTATMSNINPANFANRPHEEVSQIGKKGGQSSHSGGFASMDPDKQVC